MCFRFFHFLLLLTLVSASVLGVSRLKIVQGFSSHDPNLGVPPPLLSELKEMAHQNALKRLGTCYVQVSSWHDDVIDCKPVYKGSMHCYEAKVRSTASFIHKDNFNDPWDCRVHYLVPREPDEKKRVSEYLMEVYRKLDPSISEAKLQRLVIRIMENPSKLETTFVRAMREAYWFDRLPWRVTARASFLGPLAGGLVVA